MTEEKRKTDARAAYNALMKFYPLTLDNLDGEEWRPISGYEDLYHISNFGRVKSFWHEKIKILKVWCTPQCYLCINLTKNSTTRQKKFRINRLVAKAFIPEVKRKPDVNHIDGHKLNNHVSNLEWCNQQENTKHALETGLRKTGVESATAKLSEKQILYIRKKHWRFNANAIS